MRPDRAMLTMAD